MKTWMILPNTFKQNQDKRVWIGIHSKPLNVFKVSEVRNRICTFIGYFRVRYFITLFKNNVSFLLHFMSYWCFDHNVLLHTTLYNLKLWKKSKWHFWPQNYFLARNCSSGAKSSKKAVKLARQFRLKKTCKYWQNWV